MSRRISTARGPARPKAGPPPAWGGGGPPPPHPPPRPPAPPLGLPAPAGRGARRLAAEAARYSVDGRFAPDPERALDDSTPAFTLNLADCILCGRCVEGCQDVQHIGAIAVVGGGERAHIGAFLDQPLVESICTSCGTCVSVCPTGALFPRLEQGRRNREQEATR